MSIQARSCRTNLTLPLILLGMLTGCQRVTTVQNVQAHPHRNWFTETVYLQGTVGARAPLLKGQVYELQDQTGTVWVLSHMTQLQSGDRVLIKGRVRYQAIEIAGQNLGDVYIEEQQQLEPE
jgi:hypothetical protein